METVEEKGFFIKREAERLTLSREVLKKECPPIYRLSS